LAIEQEREERIPAGFAEKFDFGNGESRAVVGNEVDCRQGDKGGMAAIREDADEDRVLIALLERAEGCNADRERKPRARAGDRGRDLKSVCRLRAFEGA
jgi:hypothetical protein